MDPKTIYENALKEIHPSWKEVFEFAEPDIMHALKIIDMKKTVPLMPDLFNAFKNCPLDGIKVVIIGQDPYHTLDAGGTPIAHGLSFSARTSVPPSLRNMLIEIKRSYPNKIDNLTTGKRGDLTGWTHQGVLLLNACLTTTASKAGAHKGIWNGFVSKVLSAVKNKNQKIVWMLWGRKAQQYQEIIGKKGLLLLASHPSPLSVSKASMDVPAFSGCDHFKKANDYLERNGIEPVDWLLSCRNAPRA